MNDRRVSLVRVMPSLREQVLKKRSESGRWMASDVLDEIAHVVFGKLTFNEHHIQIDQRHRVFAAGRKCVFCDLPIAVAIVEKLQKDTRWFLHLYGVRDNHLVLFTVDHIVPRALGGGDLLTNYQSACQDCNTKKGSVCTNPFAAAQIRLRGKHGPA